MNGIIHGMSDDEYHARPELSSTGARMLLPEFKGSPKKFRYAQDHPRASRAFDLGHAVHAKVLGVGAGIVVYPPEHLTPSGNVSTKRETVAWEDEQRGNGLTPVSPVEVAKVDAMAEAVLSHPSAKPLLEVAVNREVSVFADVDGVPCRARFDALSDDTRSGVIAVDLKSARDATPDGFTYSVKSYGYDVQEAHYRDVYKAAIDVELAQFAFVVVESSEPFEVGVRPLSSLWVEIGRTKAARARQIYAECKATGEWPGYDPEPVWLEPPAWAVIEHELTYESGEIQV